MDGEILRDDQWEKIQPFVLGGSKGKRGPRSDAGDFFDAHLWMARAGAIYPRTGSVPIRR